MNASQTPPKLAWTWWLGLVLLAVLPYAASLPAPFFVDDYLHLDRMNDLRSGDWGRILNAWVLRAEDASAWWADPALAIQYFRPLVHVFFFLDQWVWGRNYVGFHLTNLLLHVGVTLQVYRIAARLLGAGLQAWAAAAFFALHPCHTEAVDWISGRTDLLAALFYCAAFELQARGVESKRWSWLACGLACMGLSLLSKEFAVTLPAVLLAYNLIYARERPWGWRLLGPLAAGLLVAGYLGFRLAWFGGLNTLPYPFVKLPGTPGWLWNAIAGPVMYVMDLTLFLPVDPAISQPFWREHLWAFVLVGGLCFSSLWASIRDARGWRVRAMGLAWLVFPLSPVTFGFPGERFLYLPSLGFCLLVASAKLPWSYAELPVRQRRQLWGMFAFIGLITFGKTVGFWKFSVISRGVVEEAVAELDRAPDATLLLVLDLPPIAGMGFPHAIRYERPGRRVDVELLSLAPALLEENPAAPSSVRAEKEAGRFIAERAKAPFFLDSLLEAALLGTNRTRLQPGERFERNPLSVELLKVLGASVQSIAVQLKDPARPTLLLQGAGQHLRKVQ